MAQICKKERGMNKMKTVLYKDITTNEIKTFSEAKKEYMDLINAELPVSDDEIHQVISNNLWQNGGNIMLVEDDIMQWCNDYADYNEANRYLSKEERDATIKDIYECIDGETDYLETIKNLLRKDDNLESKKLLERLEKLG